MLGAMGISAELLRALEEAGLALSDEGRPERPAWMLGGSCSLLLQNVPLKAAPHDIDLYAEATAADKLHEALRTYAVGELSEDYSRGCYSLMGHYVIEGYPLELVCGFKVCSGHSIYLVETELLRNYAAIGSHPGMAGIRLMPLAHELIFNVLRERSDRYEAIAAVMKRNLPAHLPLVQLLIERNTLEAAHAWTIADILGISTQCS
ncbi:hypothetical protein [Paenibacillus sp. CGMCC 1.18879]|uniref:hypothetical protein n=1 Tax=Paenibacillus sp. CGMCC 1.18879 TaxID=2834466 RepID=UPI00223ABA98|nr:hypothetical protein [Paenibacillus sp. CGMCC 1.18879]